MPIVNVMNKLRYLPLLAVLLSFSATADEEKDRVVEELTTAKLQFLRPGLQASSVKASSVPGYYLVETSAGEAIYMDEKASHFFAGDLIRIDDNRFVNETNETRSGARKQLLASLDESDMLVYSPPVEKVKATITVFTDIDCGYSRKLHREVPALNEAGVAVRYLAYPRAGIGSASYKKIVSAWCADNPNTALTRAKAGEAIEQLNCANPVAAQLALGDKFGVNGTPAIIFEDGRLQPGYLPADEMIKLLGIN